MIALLALIGFYIFGICCYEIFNGLLEPTNEQLIASKKFVNNRITYDTLQVVWYQISFFTWNQTFIEYSTFFYCQIIRKFLWNGYIQKSRLFEFHILEQSKKEDFFARIQKSRLLLSKKVDFSQMSKKVDFFQLFNKVDILDGGGHN